MYMHTCIYIYAYIYTCHVPSQSNFRIPWRNKILNRHQRRQSICMCVCVYVCISVMLNRHQRRQSIICMYVCMYVRMYVFLWLWTDTSADKASYVCMCVCIEDWNWYWCSDDKADCVSVGRKIVEARGKSRSTTFVQRVNRNFQTAHNGVFPSFAIFAGQLKRNQL